ncbi:MAG TPA: hypothetical protein VME66_06185 [Candidatus Acidoferrales bacterium]|nr:hypothetical protein [Candidatus Acidoferrales bacterium]
MADQGRLLTWLQRLSRNAASPRVPSGSADRPLTLSHIGSAEELAAEIAAAKQRLSSNLDTSPPTPLSKAIPFVPPVSPAIPMSATPAPAAPTPVTTPTVTPTVAPRPKNVAPSVAAREASPPVSPPPPSAKPAASNPIVSAQATPPGVTEPRRLSFVEAEERAIEARIVELRAIEERAAQRRLEIERRLAALTPEERPAGEAQPPSSPITIKIGRLDEVQKTKMSVPGCSE